MNPVDLSCDFGPISEQDSKANLKSYFERIIEVLTNDNYDFYYSRKTYCRNRLKLKKSTEKSEILVDICFFNYTELTVQCSYRPTEKPRQDFKFNFMNTQMGTFLRYGEVQKRGVPNDQLFSMFEDIIKVFNNF